MTISIFLAKIIGTYMLITSIAMLINLKFYKKALDEAVKSPMIILISAILTLILGILIVISHNVWIQGWPVIITIIGWLILIKGILLFFFPSGLSKCMKKCKMKYKIDILDWIKWVCLIALFVGAYLIYISYLYLPRMH